MPKALIAFFLGFLSFFVLMFVGETVGPWAGFGSLAVYTFTCQFLLSRRNVDAHRTGWPIMLALNAILLAAVLIMVFAEKWEVILSQGSGIPLSACMATYAGAILASLAARRTEARP
jgi:hypothetical protein